MGRGRQQSAVESSLTWSKFDDAAPKSPKALAAGNEAWGLWAAAVMYCNRHNTDGYVTLAALASDCLPIPITTTKARTLANKLCDAKSRPEGKGLFELDRNDMYRVHDFLDWNPSKVEVESKRKKDRDRKRGGPDSGGTPGAIPDGIQGGQRADSKTPRAPARALPSRPVPSQPEEEQQEQVVVDPRIPCPPDLQLAPAQRATLEGIFMPGWAIDVLTTGFAARYTADSSDIRTLEHWRKCLSMALCSDWNNSAKRPKKPDAASGETVVYDPH